MPFDVADGGNPIAGDRDAPAGQQLAGDGVEQRAAGDDEVGGLLTQRHAHQAEPRVHALLHVGGERLALRRTTGDGLACAAGGLLCPARASRDTATSADVPAAPARNRRRVHPCESFLAIILRLQRGHARRPHSLIPA